MKGISYKSGKYIARISLNGIRYKGIFTNRYEAEVCLDYIRVNYSDKSLPNEIWKSIPNYSRYEASDLGRLRSLDYKLSGIIKVLKPSITEDGYLKTMLLNDNGKYESHRVHWFVTLTFKGKRPNELEVNHKDGNKENNAINNLEYTTHSKNCQHSFDIGLQKPKRGELNGMSKLTQSKVNELRELKKNNGRFWGRNKIASELGISSKHLQKIVNKTNLW
jgi:AraC-like DNA-binding protein